MSFRTASVTSQINGNDVLAHVTCLLFSSTRWVLFCLV